jgi:hypothetical protein
VLVDHSGRAVKLSVANVSATGALFSTAGKVPTFRVGGLLFLTLTVEGASSRKIDVNARVVRRSEHDAAVDWSEQASAVEAVGELLRASQSAPR